MSLTILLAGRRPDPRGADVRRFPIENAILVRERLRALFVERDPVHLVCSAACGADLLALDVAGELGVERHIVLPFEASTFRGTSVTDRPGRWGVLYDRIIQEVQDAGGLTVLDEEPGDDAAYAAANDALLDVAASTGAPLLAVTVWDGTPRGTDDLTAHLATAALQRGAGGAEILTTG